MNAEFGYALAFATGVFGAFHCLGMCSGLAGGFFVGYGWQRNIFPFIAYHGSRIFVYSLLGITGALLGRVIVQTGIVGKGQGILMILSGVLIVLIGLYLLRRALLSRQNKPLTNCTDQQPLQFFDKSTIPGRVTPYLGGILNGLVPCSLVFSVAIKAAGTADPMRAGLLMLSFGAGTLPTMATVSAMGALLSSQTQTIFRTFAAVSVIALGLWTLYEGWIFYDIMQGLSNG
ncbi:MAG: sulfite exporter TauE/SafE family protein [Thiothrix sp.]|nr:MAG: sulfite exporter TauE/SafE family protein [Thiothrix sp.]